jgi:hypothetical protein
MWPAPRPTIRMPTTWPFEVIARARAAVVAPPPSKITSGGAT